MTARPVPDTPPFAQLLEAYFETHLARPLRQAWIKSVLKQAMALEEMRAFLDGLKGLTDFDAVDAIIERLGFCVAYENTAGIPCRGRLLVVANHPVGAADVFLMLQCLRHVREDVRVVMNRIGPQLVPHIRRLCLPVDRYASFNPDARSRIQAALRQEQAVILFPAGGISQLTIRGLRDHRWKHGAVYFARHAEADILPVYIRGRSSVRFLSLPRTLRHFLVAREMLYPVRRPITVRVGAVIPHTRLLPLAMWIR